MKNIRGAQIGNTNRLNKDRCSDEAIIEALKQGKTQQWIIDNLKTHSQRVQNLRNNISEMEEIKTYDKTHSVYIFKTTIQDSFIQNYY